MPGYDEHQMIILVTCSQSQTRLRNNGLKLNVVCQLVVDSQVGLINTGLI